MKLLKLFTTNLNKSAFIIYINLYLVIIFNNKFNVIRFTLQIGGNYSLFISYSVSYSTQEEFVTSFLSQC